MPPHPQPAGHPLRWSIALVALMLIAGATPVTAGTDDEFSAGEWTASAEASGPTAGGSGAFSIFIQGVFTADFDFTVGIDGAVSDGAWELDDGVSWWTVTFGESRGTSVLLHTAGGPVVGNSREIRAPGGVVTSQGLIEVAGVAPLEVDSADGINPFVLEVERLLCNDAWGVWIFSWNSQLSEASLSPTFAGNWHAMKVVPEDEAAAREQLEEMVPEILDLRQEMVLLWQQPQDSGVPIFPTSELWTLLERAVALINQFNNLSRCERAVFGEDVIAEYVNALTNMVVLLANLWLDNVALDGGTPSPNDVVELMTTLGAVGGIGPGAVDQDAARVTEGRLQSELRTAVEAQTSAALASAAAALLGGAP